MEAVERLPGTLIGKRVIDGIPFGSRLAALLAHLSVEDITSEKGYEKIVSVIEDAQDDIRDAKLEQAFDQAIFKGRRRQDQTLSGFVATKKAAFGELKRQGLDLLSSPAGSHLLGHLLLRQGNFSEDQRQRIIPQVEKAIRKLCGETVDDSNLPGNRARTFWQEDELGVPDEDDPDGYWQVYYQDQGFTEDLDPFEDLMEIDEGGSVYLCLDEPLPPMLDEDEAISCSGELLSFVYGEISDRWQKGKSKGKGKGKGKPKGEDKTSGRGFGVCGTYQEDAGASRGFGQGKGNGYPSQRPRTSLQEIQNRSRCRAGAPSTNLFFMNAPSCQVDETGREFFSASSQSEVEMVVSRDFPWIWMTRISDQA